MKKKQSKRHFGFDMYPHAQEFWTYCNVDLEYSHDNLKYIIDDEKRVSCIGCKEWIKKMGTMRKESL